MDAEHEVAWTHIVHNLKTVPFVRCDKCVDDSVAYRLLGNEQFAKNEHVAAIRHYTDAVRAAPTADTDALSSAYGNRSACTFVLQEYEACVRDCRRALECVGNDTARRDKLTKRATAANELQLLATASSTIVKPTPLYASAHATLAAASSGICVRYDPKYGRGLYAVHALPAGALISRESAFAWAPKRGCSDKLCAHCCNVLPLDSVPCTQCSYTLYCSELCQKLSYRRGHRFVCGSSRYLHRTLDDARFGCHVLVALAIALRCRPQQLLAPPTRHSDNYGQNVQSILSLGAGAHSVEQSHIAYEAMRRTRVITLLFRLSIMTPTILCVRLYWELPPNLVNV